MHGFFNQVLYVNLTQHTYHVEALEDKTLSSWLGGRGLGCYILCKNLTRV